MFPALIIILFNLLHFIIIIKLRKANILSQFAARKIMHLTTAAGCVVALIVLDQNWYTAICCVFIVFYFVLYFRKKTTVLDSAHHTSLGVPLYPVGLAVMSIFLWNNQTIHILGILILGISDSLSAVVEEYVKLYFSKNSRLIKFLVYYGLTICLLFFGLPPLSALGVGLILAITESVTPYGFDNLTVPIAYTASILILNLI